ncbi:MULTISPECIES: LysE family translocator [Methylobacterium]|uniref:LysE family translocator n=1 Tax=Methylobacterium TaxID=407 RepID=UPI0013EDF306|nr:LysE family translocator [Methylobacterium sp. DB0501]NGM36834.1 LysE family translocator [Methylobacterium sp. DB0501]
MISLATFATFYVAVLALQMSPGPDMLLILGRGVGQGRRVALLAATGATILAAAVQLPLLALGVASLMQASPVAFAILRWTGAAYLVWLGIRILTRAGQRDVSARAAGPVSDWTALREGMVSNLTNPKPLMFMLAFLPQFVDPTNGWPVAAQLLLLGGIQKLSGFTVLAAVAVGAGSIGGWLARHPGLIAWQERFTGLVMVGLGVRLALSGDTRSARL